MFRNYGALCTVSLNETMIFQDVNTCTPSHLHTSTPPPPHFLTSSKHVQKHHMRDCLKDPITAHRGLMVAPITAILLS